jgi:hypothetical protein
MSGSTTYIFYAIDKPLSHAQRDEVRGLSRRAEPTARRVDFWYTVDGYDLPATYESLMAKYYDIMVRQDYELWTLGMAWPYSRALHQALKPFACDNGEGCGVRVEPIDAKYKPGGRRNTKPNRLLAEISAFLDYEALETIKGLRALPWDRAGEDDVEDDEEDEYGEYDTDSWDETLVQLANSIREDALKGDVRAFYLGWEKFHDPDMDKEPKPPSGLNKLPAYLKSFGRMLLDGSNR